MSTASITPTVTVSGVNVSSYVPAGIVISTGRQELNTSFAPMTCSFQLADIDGVLRPAIGDVVAVTVAIDGIATQRFNGRVTDITYSNEQATITAVSQTWWALNACGTGFSVNASYGASVGQVRDVVSALVAYNSALTGKLPDVPAGFSSIRRDAQSFAAPTFTGALATIVNDAPLGLLYERINGKLVYTDLEVRGNTFVSSLTIAGDMIAKPVGASMSLQDVQNVVSVSYAGGTSTRTAPSSVVTYGARPSSYSTGITNDVTMAEEFGDYQLRNGAISRYRGNSITMPLASSRFTAANRVAAKNLEPSMLVATPYPRPFSTATIMWVEGYSERFSLDDWNMTLYLSDPSISGKFQTWDSIYASTRTWDQVDAALVWNDLLYTNL